MTPYAAAKKLASELKKIGYDATVWNREKCQRMGYGTADAQVACEGVDLAEMQVCERNVFKRGMQPYAGVFCEPYNGWLMSFHGA